MENYHKVLNGNSEQEIDDSIRIKIENDNFLTLLNLAYYRNSKASPFLLI